MDKIVTQETKDWMVKVYPWGDKWEKRKIIRTSMPNAWYKIGDIITVKYFASYGCYDQKDRWVNYYDLSLPIIREIDIKEKEKLIKEEILRIRKARFELRKWDDIPLSWQYNSICKILKINHDKAGRDFVFKLNLSIDENQLAEQLFNCRGHEFKAPPSINKPWYKRLFS